MPEIKIANQDTLLNVQTITTRTDNNVNTVNTNVEAVKTASDTVNTNLGKSTDTANASGATGFSLLKFLTATWTAAKAAFLDVALSSRASQTDMTAVKTLLGTANPTTANMTTIMNALKKINDAQSSGSSVIKSIQRGVVKPASGLRNVDIPINSVVPEKCQVKVLGVVAFATLVNLPIVMSLTGTTLTLRGSQDAGDVNTNGLTTMSWEITEFY